MLKITLKPSLASLNHKGRKKGNLRKNGNRYLGLQLNFSLLTVENNIFRKFLKLTTTLYQFCKFGKHFQRHVSQITKMSNSESL